jgi:hypothetical protein
MRPVTVYAKRVFDTYEEWWQWEKTRTVEGWETVSERVFGEYDDVVVHINQGG